MANNSRQKIRLGKISVLVVDDDAAISKLLQDVLKHLGFGTVQTASNAKDGLDIIRRSHVDFLITDWEMEPISGVKFAQEVRRLDPPNRFLPIIMLTGHGEKHEIELARDAGITEFLIKPFSAKTLCHRITTIVENPRSFILAPSYRGPSRRRRSDAPPGGAERRKPRTKK